MKATVLSNVLSALFVRERIETTLARAKTVKPIAERLVTWAKEGGLASRRQVLKVVPQRHVVNRLFQEVGPRLAKLKGQGGTLRLIRTGWRKGDGAPMALLEFVDFTPKPKKPKKGKPGVEAKGEEAEATAAAASK